MSCDYIKALNYAKEDQWDKAHQLVQPYSDKNSCLIHGYLHRVEGDLSNANYWLPDNTLEDELKRLYLLIGQQD